MSFISRALGRASAAIRRSADPLRSNGAANAVNARNTLATPSTNAPAASPRTTQRSSLRSWFSFNTASRQARQAADAAARANQEANVARDRYLAMQIQHAMDKAGSATRQAKSEGASAETASEMKIQKAVTPFVPAQTAVMVIHSPVRVQAEQEPVDPDSRFQSPSFSTFK